MKSNRRNIFVTKNYPSRIAEILEQNHRCNTNELTFQQEHLLTEPYMLVIIHKHFLVDELDEEV